MSNAALLVIDMQLGNFIGPDSMPRGDRLLENVRSLIDNARSVQVQVVYVQNLGEEGDPDEVGTPGFDIHPSLAPLQGDKVVQKQTPDSFHETDLKATLDTFGITSLIVAGLQTEYCVDTTCRRAALLGYKTTLVRDAHGTWDSPHLSAKQIITHHNSVLEGWFVQLKSTSEIEF